VEQVNAKSGIKRPPVGSKWKSVTVPQLMVYVWLMDKWVLRVVDAPPNVRATFFRRGQATPFGPSVW